VSDLRPLASSILSFSFLLALSSWRLTPQEGVSRVYWHQMELRGIGLEEKKEDVSESLNLLISTVSSLESLFPSFWFLSHLGAYPNVDCSSMEFLIDQQEGKK
jgi:hypothetical protein